MPAPYPTRHDFVNEVKVRVEEITQLTIDHQYLSVYKLIRALTCITATIIHHSKKTVMVYAMSHYIITVMTSAMSDYINSNLVSQSWLVGCFGFNGPLRQYFSLYRAVSQREGESGE